MNKKLIALAVAGATFAPAVMAQSANPVTLYGRIWVMANSVKATGPASLPSRITVVDESSLIGVRGTEDLGGGLKAFFQCESSAPPDAGGGTFCSRNSGVGLQGNFGSLLLGRWDSPFKLSQIFVDPYGQNTIGNQLTWIGVSGAGGNNEFNRRQNNNIQYWSPNFSGFTFRLSYGANEAKTQTINPQTTNFSLDYNKGPIRVAYSYENHKDQLAATPTAGITEKGQNLAGTFTFGPVKIGALAQKIKSSGRTDRKATQLSMVYTSGKSEFIATGGRNKDGGLSTAATQPETKVWGLGYNYNFTRRTTFMARIADVKNNAAGVQNLNGSQLPAISADADPKGFGVGFRHTF
jgi:predicted porin